MNQPKTAIIVAVALAAAAALVVFYFSLKPEQAGPPRGQNGQSQQPAASAAQPAAFDANDNLDQALQELETIGQ